jgi:hypothetical protein
MSGSFWFARLAGLSIFLCILVSGCGPGGPYVTKENYEKIKEGMTEEQVERILGKGRVVATGQGPLVDRPLPGLNINDPNAPSIFEKNVMYEDKDGQKAIGVFFTSMSKNGRYAVRKKIQAGL